MSVLC